MSCQFIAFLLSWSTKAKPPQAHENCIKGPDQSSIWKWPSTELNATWYVQSPLPYPPFSTTFMSLRYWEVVLQDDKVAHFLLPACRFSCEFFKMWSFSGCPFQCEHLVEYESYLDTQFSVPRRTHLKNIKQKDRKYQKINILKTHNFCSCPFRILCMPSHFWFQESTVLVPFQSVAIILGKILVVPQYLIIWNPKKLLRVSFVAPIPLELNKTQSEWHFRGGGTYANQHPLP